MTKLKNYLLTKHEDLTCALAIAMLTGSGMTASWGVISLLGY